MALQLALALLIGISSVSSNLNTDLQQRDRVSFSHTRSLAQTAEDKRADAELGSVQQERAQVAVSEAAGHKEGALKSPQQQSDAAAAIHHVRQQRAKRLVHDVLQNGLPSQRAPQQEGTQPALRLHAMQRLDNVSSVEWERKHGNSVGSVPLVVTNSQTDWVDPSDFTFDKFKQMVGHLKVHASNKECMTGSQKRDSEECHSVREAQPELVGKAWAGLRATNLTELGIVTFADFLDAQIAEGEAGHFMYAHDVALSDMPGMAELVRSITLPAVIQVRVPKYCVNNYADLIHTGNATAESMLDEIHFPAVFFGAAGSSSPLHSDGRMTRFWITQLQGRKLVRAVPPSENPRTYAADRDDFQPSIYAVDLMNPDFEAHPQLDGMLVYEALLQPGDVLYVPEGWGHQALNLEWTLMVTANYIDQHNLKQHLEWFAWEERDAKGDERVQHQREYEAWFLPMHSPEVERGNLPMLEYFHWHNMENAPVSQAAKRYVAALKAQSLPPNAWTDGSSMPLLISAAGSNYVNLAKWLLAQGIDILHEDVGKAALEIAKDNDFTRMAALLRERIAEARGANGEDPADADDEEEEEDPNDSHNDDSAQENPADPNDDHDAADTDTVSEQGAVEEESPEQDSKDDSSD